jgi:1-aminocyclopropane-1-carboxylate deaminase
LIPYHPIIQHLPAITTYHVDVLRLDLIDAEVSGNKWFKLKRNIEKALAGNFETIVTFGGAFSNHIAATSAACKKYKIRSVGIIRGEETLPLNPTLLAARENGMHLHFVKRDLYSQKWEDQFKEMIEATYGRHYLIPEGGNNREGVLGCTEILNDACDHDFIFCACGTATTYAGLLASSKPHQAVIGISVLKGKNTLPEEAEKLLKSIGSQKITVDGNEKLNEPLLMDSCITNRYCFKGYAGFDAEVVKFKYQFENAHQIPLDYVYNDKLVYAVFDLMEKKKFKPGARILMVHGGGLQGNNGFERRYQLKPTL